MRDAYVCGQEPEKKEQALLPAMEALGIECPNLIYLQHCPEE